MKEMDNNEIEKSKAVILADIIEYVPNSVIIRSILQKTTGTVSIISCDIGEALTEQTIPFDNYIQIIDGKAEIVMDGISNLLETGQSIIIPAHTSNIVKATERFKMISTIMKC
jgi:quercetin dioxygenase-like cupin family protein